MRILTALLVAWAAGPALAKTPEANDGFDVSYAWSGELPRVVEYRRKVLHTLGPGLEEKLLVVRGGRLYGLVYDRNGDAESTARAAASHGRVLRSRGLEGASAIKSRRWPVVFPAESATQPRAPEQGAIAAIEGLQERVDAFIRDQRKRRRILPDERTSWSVYDLTSGEKLVDINEDEPMQAASMVKPFFALAYFHKVRDGEFGYTDQDRRQLERMIQRSSNGATNWVLRRLGGPEAVDSFLKKHYTEMLRDTRIVEYIPAGGRTYRNQASVHDYSRFLTALWHGNLPGAEEIKRIMSLPNRDRIYSGPRGAPGGPKVYNKTGSTKHLCGDMGILEVRGPEGDSFAYTLIGVIEKSRPASNYTRWISARGKVIREVSNLVFTAMLSRHAGPQTANP